MSKAAQQIFPVCSQGWGGSAYILLDFSSLQLHSVFLSGNIKASKCCFAHEMEKIMSESRNIGFRCGCNKLKMIKSNNLKRNCWLTVSHEQRQLLTIGGILKHQALQFRPLSVEPLHQFVGVHWVGQVALRVRSG